MIRAVLTAACAALMFASPAAPVWAQSGPCGRDGAACEIPEGTYRIITPQGEAPDAGWPAMMFFHGAGGSGARTLDNTGMVTAFVERGYAVIAPDGLPRPNSRFGPGWSFHPDFPSRRDEVAFTRAVTVDAAARHSIDPAQLILSGFSIGGSLVWYMACEAPDLARAYAPVGGAFWRPHPEAADCAGPVRMLHTHGWRDRVVPLEGRPLRSGAVYQGDVFHGLDILRQVNGCSGMRADEFLTDADTWRRAWTTCSPGTALELILHPGGHAVPRGWADQAIDWFEALDLQKS
ncbi:MAG: alpha/beta fold hydrolase [Pseudomonadota bacterium]